MRKASPTRRYHWRFPSPAGIARAVDWRADAGCFALGWLGLGTQTYLLREFLVALGGDETCIGLGLATWLGGIACGAAIARALGNYNLKNITGTAVSLLAPVAVFALILARVGRCLANAAHGELLGIGASLLLAISIFAIPGLLIGATFVMFFSLVASRNHDATSIGHFYVLESLGSLAAGVIVTWALIPFVAPMVGYFLQLALALLLWLPAARSKLIAGYRVLLAEIIILAGVCATPSGHRIESKLQQVRFESFLPRAVLLDWVDTPYSHVALSKGETHALYSGGAYALSFPDPFDDEARAHPLMLLNRSPRRVLVLGTIEPGLLQYMLAHPVEHVDWVSVDERAHAFVLKYLDPEARNAFADRRVRCAFEDPRAWLQRSSSEFDVIFQLEREPSSLMLARNWTLEFARLLRKRLAPGGTLITRFAAGPNVQVGPRGLLGASLYSTLREAFPFVLAIPYPLDILIAGASPEAVAVDHRSIVQRWYQRSIATELVTPETLTDMFPPERIATLNRELAQAARTAAVSTGDRPVAFLHAVALRERFTSQYLARPLAAVLRQPTMLYALALLPSTLWVVCAFFRGRQDRTAASIVHAAAVAGATSMTLDLLVLFSFQTSVGALYSEVGMLTGVFMLGLALGGYFGRRSAALIQAQVVVFGVTLVSLLFWASSLCVTLQRAVLILLHCVLLLVVGIATGLVFPISANALIELGRRSQSAAGAVETADHSGAALAALVSSVALVPVVGLKNATLLLLGLQSIGIALSASALRSRP